MEMSLALSSKNIQVKIRSVAQKDALDDEKEQMNG